MAIRDQIDWGSNQFGIERNQIPGESNQLVWERNQISKKQVYFGWDCGNGVLIWR
ncbi:hypothetical protein [Bacillus sp. FJAT-22090]|uniref:hypothetical protein n=1 Tax=Bacillus sp. FJAT-22090 TaxID=1581038 RepID=UPI001C92E799|nr:hypothetical protein [Bacillus sp. FJAT-22090]